VLFAGANYRREDLQGYGLNDRLRPVFDPQLAQYPVIVPFNDIQVLIEPVEQAWSWDKIRP
jgi:hypothetical protein